MILGSPSVSMDDLSLYMQDLKRVQSMNFTKLYLVHTHTLEPEHIVVDAAKKIQAYITYREERERFIYNTIQLESHKILTRYDLFDIIYQNEDLSDPLRFKLAERSYLSHLEKLIKEGKVRYCREGIQEVLKVV
jgi:hypothetical protein